MKLGKRQLRTLINEMMGDLDIGLPKYDGENVDFDLSYDEIPKMDDNSEVQSLHNDLSDVDIISALTRLNNADDRIAGMIAYELYGDKPSQEAMLDSGMLQLAVSAALQRLSTLLMTDDIEKLKM